MDVNRLSCRGESHMFDLRVSFANGNSIITRNTSDVKPLDVEKWTKSYMSPSVVPPSNVRNATYLNQELGKWTQSVAGELPLMNEMALLDSVGVWMNANISQTCFNRSEPMCNVPFQGERIRLKIHLKVITLIRGVRQDIDSFQLQGTALHTTRFENPPNINSATSLMVGGETFSYDFDPVTDINPTEELLNELLFNVTLSSLALGLWKDSIPVTTTTSRNVYKFSHRKNLVLPYSISLGVAVIFGLIAVWSLHKNGASAADGGFLQVMMATRGDTAMERLVLKGGVKEDGEASKELGKLKVRYGQFIEAEGGEGFGTVDETVGLRRRK